MPFKPLHPCAQPGCPALTNKRYCPKHQHEVDAYYNKNLRDPAERQRYGAEWRRIQANNLWFQIYQAVRENNAADYSGKTPHDDVMERILNSQ